VDGILRGHNRFAYIQPRYILDDRSFAQAGLVFSRNSTRMQAYGEDSWRYALGAYHFFTYGFSLFAELSLTETRYHDKLWYITRDHRIDEIRRGDKTWQFYASLSSNIFESRGITPVLQYYYVKRDSNIWSREYDRHRINLSFNIRF
jgi:hypothetical protein